VMKRATRRLVWERAGHRCKYCRLDQNHEPFFRFHVEHIVAKQHQGTDHSANLALACHHCNDHKGTNLSGIDPRSRKVVRLFDPRRERWQRHFRLVGPVIVGRTRCGRATVAVLAMNHPHRLELRAEVIAAGQFESP
jgi:HNH endonuclease